MTKSGATSQSPSPCYGCRILQRSSRETAATRPLVKPKFAKPQIACYLFHGRGSFFEILGRQRCGEKPMREIHAPCQQSNPVKPSQGSLTGELWFDSFQTTTGCVR